MSMSRARLILADDHDLFREGLAGLINAQPDLEVAGQAGDGLEALTLARDVKPDLIIMDLSFISITMVLPVLSGFAKAKILALVKPQFEAPKPLVGRGGVIRDAGTRLDVVLALKQRIENMGFAVRGFTPAGLKGKKGNQEYFFLLEFGKKKSIDDTMIRDEAAV